MFTAALISTSKTRTVVVLCCTLALAATLFAANLPTPPESGKQAVTDTYHNTDVTENYRWLEDFENTTVQEWNTAQNVYSREILDKVAARPAIKEFLTELMGGEATDYYYLKSQAGVLFAFKFQPPKEQPLLITLESPFDLATERAVLDLNERNPEGTTSIDFYVPSPDASLVAVSLSEFGSEKGNVHIFEVATGNELPDIVPGVNGPTAGGDVAWSADGSGFYYTRYPQPGERPEEDLSFYHQVFYHKMGAPIEKDTYSIGEEFPRIAENQLDASEDGQYFLTTVANGDGGEYTHYLLGPEGEWRQITQNADLIPTVKFGPDNSLYLLSNKNTPKGSILHLPPGETDLTLAKTIVAESDVTIKSFVPTERYLFLIDLDGGPTTMRVVRLADQTMKPIPTAPVSSAGSMFCVGGDVVLFRSTSYTEPSVYYQFNPLTWDMKRTSLYKTSPADFSDVEVVREFATSKDGTKVPVNIIKPQGTKLDGENPTILYAYGGYGISLSPRFDATLRLWLDQGGIYVVANLRGGGEYGEEWHLAGNLTQKQNVFDDFAACAEYLIESGYTNPSKLCIKGGSNGGLLMGAAFTQHPELYRAVVSSVGIYDMLRVELDPNGVFNITEFGTVKNPDHFKALYAYSPYHNVKVGTAYPSVLFLTGDHDGRVNPSQSRKMTACLQAATSSANPIMLRTDSKTGHGGGTALSRKIEYQTDVYAFIISQLDLKFKHDR
ncbi:MAG: prolyl oligopeptidase family serine peptidase [candidate division Zixibacteria bacterium]|nr:prolyl oligopeptidase family serine peptidase [candidate division Zixibacteria bacterium]MDH3937845.1 prolyl oligopeptidase family serine peptidase [candidate division Zixibacteria bacterium]MDH4032304.1 prolyl oligopeptidase family serine peptidase [candidate division Zixibacteria bacterium]